MCQCDQLPPSALLNAALARQQQCRRIFKRNLRARGVISGEMVRQIPNLGRN
jgi:hypothetical protein